MAKKGEAIKVRVTSKKGYIYNILRKKDDEFDLEDVECVNKKDPETGKPLIYTAQEQFSSKWMEKI